VAATGDGGKILICRGLRPFEGEQVPLQYKWGPTGPFSLKTVHWTVFRAFEPSSDLPEIRWISGRQICKVAFFTLVDKLPAVKKDPARGVHAALKD